MMQSSYVRNQYSHGILRTYFCLLGGGEKLIEHIVGQNAHRRLILQRLGQIYAAVRMKRVLVSCNMRTINDSLCVEGRHCRKVHFIANSEARHAALAILLMPKLAWVRLHPHIRHTWA